MAGIDGELCGDGLIFYETSVPLAVDGAIVNVPGPWYGDSGPPVADGDLIGTLTLATAVYEYQAVDSVTGALYTWTLTTRAFNGAGYPGPNAPLGLFLVAARPL